MSESVPHNMASLASIKAKADEFAAKNDRPGRAKAKQAILEELNSQMQIKAEKMRIIGQSCNSQYNDENVNRLQSPKKEPTNNLATQTKVLKSGHAVTAKSQVRKKRQYDPAYTWNRGGRVKELRIRTVARKYLHIWRRKSFGRVTPSTASSLYQRTLVKKCFQEWHTDWWTARREWGLGVRADLHNRYRLWNKVWSAWREYTVIHRVKTAQKKIAARHANAILLKRIMQEWRRYIEIRRTKKALAEQADDVYGNNLTRHAWYKWQMELEIRNHQHEQEMTALEVWAHNLQSKAWTIWYNQWQMRKHERHREKQAQLISLENLQTRCLKAWKSYVQERQRKNKLKAMADKARRNFVLERCMNKWEIRWEECHTLRVHKQRIIELSCRSRCRRILEHWKMYVNSRKEDRLQQAFAVDHCNVKLMKTCLSGLKLNVIQKKLQSMRYAIAEEHYESTLVKRGWSAWIRRMDDREEFWMAELTQKAKQHYREITLKKYLTKWQSYNKWRVHRKDQYAVADAHHYMTVMPQCLSMWYQFVELQIRKRDLNEMAAKFESENVQGKYFYEWKAAYHASQDHRMMERMAILHHNELVTKRVFLMWKKKAEDAVQMSLKQELACEHYNQTSKRKHFQLWLTFIQNARKTYENDHLAVRHHYLKQLNTAWTLWTNYTDKRRMKAAKNELAHRHNKQVILLRTLVAWKHYNRWMKEVQQIAQAKWTVKCEHKKRKCLALWQNHVVESKEMKKKERLASNHRNTVLKQMVLQQWHSYTIYRVNKVFEKEEKLREVRKRLEKVKIKCIFQRWKERSDESALNNIKKRLADCHYQKVVLLKSMSAWTAFTKLSLRKQLLNRQCMWFHNTRLTAKFFYQWKVSLNNQREVMDKTYAALWHWSLTLERKVFVNWFYFTRERQRKKSRYSVAMEKHRMFLLRQGSTKWLTVASDMASIREKVAAKQGAQYAYKTWQVVQKCAHHWRQWAARRRSERPFAKFGHSDKVKAAKPISAPKLKAVQQLVKSVDRPAESLVSPAKSVSCRAKIQEPQRGNETATKAEKIETRTRSKRTKKIRRHEQTLRPKPKMPSFLVDSLKKDGLYVSNGSQEHLMLAAATATVHNTSVKNAFNGEDEESDELNSSDQTEPKADIEYNREASENTHQYKSVAAHKLERDNPISAKTQDYKLIEESVPEKGVSMSEPATFVKSTKKKEDTRLLPPAAFLLKKDGSPILEGSTILPNVFRTDSELLQGQATLKENHFAPLAGAGSTLQPPGNFQSEPLHQKLSPRDYRFVSPAEEMVYIRNALQDFKHLKEKHRQVVAQEKQLSSWLADQPSDSQDPDVIVTRQELNQVRDELTELAARVKSRKVVAHKLTERVQQLLPTLSQ